MNVFIKKWFFSVVFIGIGVFLLSGCAKYHSRQLPAVKDEIQTMNGVSVGRRFLDKDDCKDIFGSGGSEIYKNGLQPTLLSIRNDSDRIYSLDAHNINVDIVSPRSASRLLHKWTTLRVVSWTVAGLFLWPFFIGAGADGALSYSYNKDADRDFEVKSFHPNESVLIRAHENFLTVMFTKKRKMSEEFIVTLVDQIDKQELGFLFAGPDYKLNLQTPGELQGTMEFKKLS